MLNTQQASRTITNALKLFFNQAPKKCKFLANMIMHVYLKQIRASNLPADGQLLFTPSNHKE